MADIEKSLSMYNLETGLTTWTETRTETGYKLTREVTATEWVESERTDCYCCSCGDYGSSDPYCRNHGFAGMRPCERHKLPGFIDEHFTPGRTEMHDSVQKERERVYGA